MGICCNFKYLGRNLQTYQKFLVAYHWTFLQSIKRSSLGCKNQSNLSKQLSNFTVVSMSFIGYFAWGTVWPALKISFEVTRLSLFSKCYTM